MKPTTPRRRLLKGTVFALTIAAMSTQVGGATPAPRVAVELPMTQVQAAAIPVPGERELLAWFAKVVDRPPVPGSWALLVAGLAGAWAIGRRRMSVSGSRSLDPYRLRHR